MSKPKPGLGKGIVRTLAHHQPSSSASAAIPAIVSQYQHREHHVHAHSSSLSTPPVFPLPDPAPTSSSSSHHRRASFSPPGPSSAYLSLLPPVDVYAPPIDLSRLSLNSVVLPYQAPRAKGKTPRPAAATKRAIRHYTTPSHPNRAAVETAYVAYGSFGAPWGLNGPPLPPSLLTFEGLAFRPKPSHDNFFSAPPPPPPSSSPGPDTQPPQPAKSRPAESHTVLSVTPVPTTSSDSPTFSLAAHPTLHTVQFDEAHLAEPPSETDAAPLGLYSSSLIFHLGSFGVPKERQPLPPPLASARSPPPLPTRARSFVLPEVTPPVTLRSKGIGEDAYFARLDGMCIADGVGSWAKSRGRGADASRWAQLLTHFCEGEVDSWWSGKDEYVSSLTEGSSVGATETDDGPHAWARGVATSNGDQGDMSTGLSPGKRRRPLDPVEIMQRGFEKCLACAVKEGIHGSSTCLLALLHHSTLLIANLGDCALLLIRNGEVVFRTTEMQHAFNFPLQVGTHSRDEPMKDAKRYDVGVDRGDVVILASDGLTDNLFDDEILDVLAEFAPPSLSPRSSEAAPSQLPTPPQSRPATPAELPPFSPQKFSEALAKRARGISEQTTASTPFMHRATEEGIDFVGGKRDDISVVVGVIGDRDESLSPGLALHM